MNEKTCYIIDIQRFSIHDGPGIRTNVFLKGCYLRCKWCCNPESQNFKPELLFEPEKCIGCGYCSSVCPTGASFIADGRVLLDRNKCIDCGLCTKECYPDARYMKGSLMTVNEVIREIVKDISFYNMSGGGITISGGEPIIHGDFVTGVLSESKSRGINTAIETCGFVKWNEILKVFKYTDLFLFDIKHMDSRKHREFTGKGNELIQDNIRKLAALGANIIIRVPVIPTFNMDLNSLSSIIQLAEEIGVNIVHLLPYHRYALGKYNHLGRQYWSPGVEKADIKKVAELARSIETDLVSIKIGG